MELKRAERRFKLTTRDYAQLAAFRHALRGFLRFSEAAAAEAGLTAQHYQAMLVLRGWPEDQRVSDQRSGAAAIDQAQQRRRLGRPAGT